MEGVTDASFRGLVAQRGGVGLLCTEFIRISNAPLPKRILNKELGDERHACPIGLQLMAADTRHLSETIKHAEHTHAEFVDLNFGCPVKRVFSHCAGSALLDYPEKMHEIISCAVRSTKLPVTAKIRAGVKDRSLMSEVIDAIHEAGAQLITLHARLRTESYTMPAHWDWLSEAVEYTHKHAKPLPIIANGGIDDASDIDAVISQTGCAGVMIGRAAIANPFIFREYAGGSSASRNEMIHFVIDYWEAMNNGRVQRGGLGRIKQILKYAQGNLLFEDEETKLNNLRAQNIQDIWEYMVSIGDQSVLDRIQGMATFS